MRSLWLILIGALPWTLCAQHAEQHQHRSWFSSVVRLLYPDAREEEVSRKCGTPMLVPATLRWQEFSTSVKAEIQQSFARPERQKSRLSPSARFRIHYDTTGVETPALLNASNQRIPNSYEAYVDSVAFYLDFCWRMLIDSLGYGAPPQDGLEGGGPEYDVYIGELGFGFSGITSWDPARPLSDGSNKRYATYTEVDNDFLDVRTKGMNGLKITVAHEFFHAIQVGSYGIWTSVPNSDFYFYELTAVWVEDALFTEVNDYLFDLPQYFQQFRDLQNRSLSFTTFNPFYPGYERSVWAHFLAKRFGREAIRRTWETMRTQPFVFAMDAVLREFKTTLREEYATFSQWNFFTAQRADTMHYYPEGNTYPLLKPNAEMRFDGFSGVSVRSESYPLSTQTYLFVGVRDSLMAIVADVDDLRARESRDETSAFEIRLTASTPTIPYQILYNGLHAGFSANNTSNWRVVYLQAVRGYDGKQMAELSPNPVRLAETTRMNLPVTAACTEATVYFFSTSFDLLFSGIYNVTEYLGKRYVYVPTNDFSGKIASGIYFVVLECGEARSQWKVAILH